MSCLEPRPGAIAALLPLLHTPGSAHVLVGDGQDRDWLLPTPGSHATGIRRCVFQHQRRVGRFTLTMLAIELAPNQENRCWWWMGLFISRPVFGSVAAWGGQPPIAQSIG